MTSVTLNGMTWDHERAIRPLEAVSDLYASEHPEISIRWDARPLQAFESQPLHELAATYDLMVIDHPHIGEAVQRGLLVDLGATNPEAVALLAEQSAGQSHQSYSYDGGQWALAIDAATPVASYRSDLLPRPPSNWSEVVKLAERGEVIMPMRPPHVLMAFMWIANNFEVPMAKTPDRFVDPAEGVEVLERLLAIATKLDPRCKTMDPIDVYEEMTAGDRYVYCPSAYGYISYARDGFRPNRLTFADVLEIGTEGTSGTVLGGTGIAVSQLSQHKEAAIDFAFRTAGAEWQSGAYTLQGGQPGNVVAWRDEACNAACHDFLSGTLRTLETSWVRPRYPGYLEFQGAASELLNEVLFEGTDVETGVGRLNELYRESRRAELA